MRAVQVAQFGVERVARARRPEPDRRRDAGRHRRRAAGRCSASP